jgi:hypothetical protein
MSTQVRLQVEVPEDLGRFKLPSGVNERLQTLLNRQDRGEDLTTEERREAEGLVDLAEMLTLLKLRTERAWQDSIS